MNVIECHFEFCGFDDHLVKGGISVYLWNLCRHLRRRGEAVSGLSTDHGLIGALAQRYDVEQLPWRDQHSIEVPLDPVTWEQHGPAVLLSFDTTAYRLRAEGVDVVLLSDELLHPYGDTFYPPHEAKGRDLAFLKPLAFQVAATRYLLANAPDDAVVHLHEPIYHYLVAAALADRGLTTVCTVQSNMPANKKVYGPEVRALLKHLGSDGAVLDDLVDPPLDSPLHRAMLACLPITKLNYTYPERAGHDYVSVLGLVARSATALDFLSPGQLAHVSTQEDTPFEQLFSTLAVRNVLRRNAHKMVVGGCGLGESWLRVEPRPGQRAEVLGQLGLDADLPTIFHNARYAVDHKGQHEMAEGLRRLLTSGQRVNVLLHCLSLTPLNDPPLQDLARDFPDVVRLETRPMTREDIEGWACAADICLYPSKFEMDTFLLGMGEAMACGAIPVATAQAGMRHFGHVPDPTRDLQATGLALPRSFRRDDTLLVEGVFQGLTTVVGMIMEDPEFVSGMRTRARDRARTFTWDRVAEQFAAIFVAARAGTLPDPEPRILLERGWADLIDERKLLAVRSHATQVAWERGDLALARRLGLVAEPGPADGPNDPPPGGDPWDRLYESARRRGDITACRQIADAGGRQEHHRMLRERGQVTPHSGGSFVSWQFTPAARVEVATLDGRLCPLERRSDDTFAGYLSDPPEAGVALLITLNDGRACWDWLETETSDE